MAEFDIEQMLQDPEQARKAQEMLAEIDRRLEESRINYRFAWQMLGEETSLPTRDVLSLVIANTYSELLKYWDHDDYYLPLMFAVLTVREVTKDDR